MVASSSNGCHLAFPGDVRVAAMAAVPEDDFEGMGGMGGDDVASNCGQSDIVDDVEPLAKRQKKEQATFPCKYHRKNCPLSLKVPSYNVCRSAKKAYDALKRLSVKQNEQEWFRALCDDPKKLTKSIVVYEKSCPGDQGRGNPRSRTEDGAAYKVAELKEFIEAESGVEFIGLGVMMWKEQYLIWAASVEAGYIPRGEAEAIWDSWCTPNSVLHSDEKGPKQAPHRVRVIIQDQVNMKDAFKASRWE